jgi:phage-related protein (TIGR01555 family)
LSKKSFFKNSFFKNPFSKNSKISANDGFANIAKGIGGKKDVLQNSSFIRSSISLTKNYHLAEELYLYNWLVGNIADIPATQATRKWCEITSNSKPQEMKKIVKLFKKLEVKQRFKTAQAYGDLFGGSALYMVVNDGNTQDKPLNLKTIKRGSFKKLRVLEPSHLIPIITTLREPEQYRLSGTNGESFVIHKSRLLIFIGLELTQSKKLEHSYWGGSKVQRSLEPIIASDTAINAIVNMLTETNVNVYKLDGLTELAIDDADEDAIKRIQIIDTMKSYLNALVLDSKDDFIKRTNDFKDLHQIDNATLIRVTGSAEIPATLLFGKSPDGMNATGASDFENFYNRIEAIQTDKFEPKLERLVQVASMSENGFLIEDDEYFWNPLSQETKKDISDREKIDAETDSTLIADEIITKAEARSSLIKNNPRYSHLKDSNEKN